MNTDTAGNPIPLVPAYCGRCGGPTDTGGQCTARCLEPMTPTKAEPRDVEQAVVPDRELLERCMLYCTESEADAIRALLSSHDRLTREVDRLRTAALDLVAEYRSHGGKGTHQRCHEGACCVLPAKVDALAAVLEAKPE